MKVLRRYGRDIKSISGQITKWCGLSLAIGAVSSVALAQVNVVTERYDISRTGQNTQETILTHSNVNANQFGKLFSWSVNGQPYAQPLYMGSVSIPGKGTHNVVYVATEGDGVYAFDADSNTGSNSSALWFADLTSSSHGAASGATTIPHRWPRLFRHQSSVWSHRDSSYKSRNQTLYVVSATLEGVRILTVCTHWTSQPVRRSSVVRS